MSYKKAYENLLDGILLDVTELCENLECIDDDFWSFWSNIEMTEEQMNDQIEDYETKTRYELEECYAEIRAFDDDNRKIEQFFVVSRGLYTDLLLFGVPVVEYAGLCIWGRENFSPNFEGDAVLNALAFKYYGKAITV